MMRSGGENTRKKILEAAEDLFSKNGFHETSIKQITKAAGVNQGLVYYYFKDKNDIVASLFTDTVRDLSAAVEGKSQVPGGTAGAANVREAIRNEVLFLAEKSRIISIMLAESLKAGTRSTTLFQCADIVMNDHHGNKGPGSIPDTVREFFTGFIPLVAFAALRDRFCDYFGCDPGLALEAFVDAFMASHASAHHERGEQL
jgi:AcrR family transcriptional regulator